MGDPQVQVISEAVMNVVVIFERQPGVIMHHREMSIVRRDGSNSLPESHQDRARLDVKGEDAHKV
jgi:hypothetical protein